MELRNYQNEALNALYDYLELNKTGNPCIVCPTGAGKSLIIATICKDVVAIGKRVLVVAHRKELLVQQVDKLNKLAPEVHFGVYSAGLNRRELGTNVVVAGIQSVYQKAKELTKYDPIDYIIIDEVHLLPAGKDGVGRYHTLLNALTKINPEVRLIGLTATPFRMKTGLITDEANFINQIVFDVPIKRLIADGYLSPLRSKILPYNPLSFDRLHVRNGEFVAEEVDRLYDKNYITKAVHEFTDYANKNKRQSVLVFCSSVERAYETARTISEFTSEEVGVIVGDTLPILREETIRDFITKKLRYLVNVDVLTTGFDAPNVDCIVMLRPTMSAGLYVQIAGRGSRICEGKEDCVFLDYGGNIARHGAIDQVMYLLDDKKRPEKRKEPRIVVCSNCFEAFEVNPNIKCCPHCGQPFSQATLDQIREYAEHESKASELSILSDENSDEGIDLEVVGIDAWTHFKRNDDGTSPPTMWIKYHLEHDIYVSNFICLEHPEGSYARKRAETWWKKRSKFPVPHSVDAAVRIFHEKGVAIPQKMRVTRDPNNRRYFQIVAEFGLKLPEIRACEGCAYLEETGECILGKMTKEKCGSYASEF
jgi:DNA repair protein RadD